MADRTRRPAAIFAAWAVLCLLSKSCVADPAPKIIVVPPDADISSDYRKVIEEINGDIGKKDGKDLGRISKELARKLRKASAAAKDPDFPPNVREQVSDLDNALGLHKEAKDISDVTLMSDPKNKDALNNRAFASYGLKEYKNAEADSRRALEVDPTNEQAFTTLALTHYAEEDYLQAMEDARRALALNKDNETAFYVLKVAQGRLRPAKLNLSALEQARAEQIQREYQIALAQQNETASVMRDAPAAATPAAVPFEALRRQAAEKLARRDYWGAIVDADKLLVERPGDNPSHALRATAYNLVGRCEDALKDATVSLESPTAEAYDARSLSNYCLGRYVEAAADATRAISLKPSGAYAFLHRARALERMLNIPAALADYRRAADLNPQFEPSYRQAVATYGKPPSTRDPEGSTSASLGRRGRNVGTPPWLWAAFLLGGLLVGFGIFGVGLSLSKRSRAAAPPPAFQGLQNYRLIRELAEGGMGVVYEAFDEALDRTVAVKRMRDEIKLDADSRDRFLDEARTVAALRHPNIMEIFSILDSPEDLFLVFEYIPGELLSERLRKRFLSPQEVRRIFHGMCSAVEYAHRHGVIHRDLKPTNVMITEEGTAKVMDFGIAHHARQMASREESAATIAGTLEYMAPEARNGLVRPESDVFALGVCLREMLRGGNSHPGATTLLEQALAPDPDRRIGSASALWKSLADLPDEALLPSGGKTSAA